MLWVSDVSDDQHPDFPDRTPMMERAKRVLKNWLPPAAIASVRRIPRHIWDGAYDSFAKVPSSGGGYSDKTAASDTVAMTRGLIEQIQTNPNACDASPRD